MLDDVSGASAAARRAAALSPQLARTHVVQGYTSLAEFAFSPTRWRISSAPSGSSPAIRWRGWASGWRRFDRGNCRQDAPISRVAAALSPNDAIVRSYLGKAYFDERNDTGAAQEFQAAKLLDESDPTPFFYDAIRKEMLHRPIEALQHFQTSIALNDHSGRLPIPIPSGRRLGLYRAAQLRPRLPRPRIRKRRTHRGIEIAQRRFEQCFRSPTAGGQLPRAGGPRNCQRQRAASVATSSNGQHQSGATPPGQQRYRPSDRCRCIRRWL